MVLNKLAYRILVIFLFCFLAESIGNNVRIVGWVLDERDRPLRDVVINVFEGDRKIDEVEASRRGRFTVDIGVNGKYIIEITAPDRVPKMFLFNTEVPPALSQARGLGFEFVMDLFPNYPGLELELFKKPLLNFYFDTQQQTFAFDQSEYEVVFVEIEAAKDYIEELFVNKKEYDDIVMRADRLFQDDKLEEALELYTQAADFNLPNEPHAANQVNAIYRRLGIPTPDEVKQYEEFIAMADNKFYETEYELAIGYYRDALNIISDKSYPVERIDECERILNELAIADMPEEVIEEEVIVEPEPVKEVIAAVEPEPVVVPEPTPEPVPEPVVERVVEPDYKEERIILEDVAKEIADIVRKETAVVDERPVYVDIKRPEDYVSKKWEMTADQIEQLNVMAERISTDPGANLIIHSYVNLSANKLNDFYLSKVQSTAAIHYLLNKGIDINRLYQVSYTDPGNLTTNEASTLQFEIKYDQDFHQFVKDSHKRSLHYLNNIDRKVQFDPQVEFLVQFVAAINPVAPEYYKSISNRLPDKTIYYYYGEQRLHHYSVGNIKNLATALKVHRDLRDMGFDTYIIALLDGNRVLTTEISELLNRN